MSKLRHYMNNYANREECKLITICKGGVEIENACDILYLGRDVVLRLVRRSGYLTRITNKIYTVLAGKTPEVQEDHGKGIVLDTMESVNIFNTPQKEIYKLYKINCGAESVIPAKYETFTAHFRHFRRQYHSYWYKMNKESI